MPRTLAQNAQYIAETIKPAIKSAIEAQGVTVSSTDSFLDYADRIAEIEGSGGGGGKEIDISKADYSVGSGANPKVNNGRILSGFANMSGYHARPLDASGNWLDVDWSKSWEVGIAFKFSSLSANQAIFASASPNSELAPTLLWVASDGSGQNQIRVLVSSDGSSWAVTAITSFVPVIDTFYFLKMIYNASTKALITQVTSDFTNWTTIESDTMSASPYYSGAGIVIGGRGGSSSWTTNNLLIDTFNTYLKDNSGEIVWGAYAGAFDDGKYPVISGEYQLYDYIESNGTQVIDTGHQLTSGDTVNIHYIPISDGMNYGSAWGFVWSAVTTSLSTSGLLLVSNSLKDRYDKDTQIDRTSWNNWQIYTDSLTVNNTMDASVELFGTLKNANAYSKIRLYSFSINDNFYLPAKRKSDGVFGLWDVSNQTFLTDSAGGNAFVGGNPIGNFDVFPKYTYVDGATYQGIGDSGIGSYRKIDTLPTTLLNATAMTCEVCARFDSFVNLSSGPYARIITFGDDNQTGRFGFIGLVYDGSSSYDLCVWDDTIDLSSGLCVWTPTDTHTVAVVKTTAGAIKIYVDGVLKYTGSSALTITNTLIDYITQRARTNTPSDTQRQINGEIFAWRIYPRELSSVEIEQNYKADYQNIIK